MAAGEVLVWVGVYVLAGVSGTWLGWLAKASAPRFTLAAVVLGLQLPLVVVGAASYGPSGVVEGVVVGLVLGTIPLSLAVTWCAAASGGTMGWLRQIPEGVLPWGVTVWAIEGAAVATVLGRPAWVAAMALGGIPLLWGLDRFVHDPKSWGQRVALAWIVDRSLRIATTIAVLNVGMSVSVAFGLRHGTPTQQAVTRHLSESLPIARVDGLTMLALVVAIAAVFQLLDEANRDQRLLVAIGCLVPLCGWLFAASLLPPSLADFGFWGVLLSSVCFLVVVLGLWVDGRPDEPETSQDPQSASGTST